MRNPGPDSRSPLDIDSLISWKPNTAHDVHNDMCHNVFQVRFFPTICAAPKHCVDGENAAQEHWDLLSAGEMHQDHLSFGKRVNVEHF